MTSTISTTRDSEISRVSSDVWTAGFGVTSGLLGLLHLALASEYLAEDRLVGGGFVVGGVALVLAAAALLLPVDRRILGRSGSILVVVLAALVDLGGILSRTVGLPDELYEPGHWETSLVVSIVLGIVALVLASLAVPRLGGASGQVR